MKRENLVVFLLAIIMISLLLTLIGLICEKIIPLNVFTFIGVGVLGGGLIIGAVLSSITRD